MTQETFVRGEVIRVSLKAPLVNFSGLYVVDEVIHTTLYLFKILDTGEIRVSKSIISITNEGIIRTKLFYKFD